MAKQKSRRDKQKSAREFAEQAIDAAQKATRVSQKNLIIWGGAFPAERLSAFFAAWGTAQLKQMQWRMYEYVHRFHVVKATARATLPPAKYLERVRLFGQRGDLDLRRDGEIFHWRFLGDAKPNPPKLAGEFKPQDFWANQPSSLEYREIEMKYYQWHGNERRVDSSWLTSAGLKAEGVFLIQKHYLRNGRVEFVRYVGFDGEAKNGKRKNRGA